MIRRVCLFCALLGLAWAVSAASEDLAALYQKALKAFYAGEYVDAESDFATVYRLAPQAPYAADAAFKAGESAFRQERYAAAVRHFSHYLRAYPIGSSADEVKIRLAQARQKADRVDQILPLPEVRTDWPRLVAAWADQLPFDDAKDLEKYLGSLAKNGYNAVVINAYKLPGAAPLTREEGPACPAGAYFASATVPVCRDQLDEWIVNAHKFNLRLIAVLPVRSLVQNTAPEQWDRRFDPKTNELAADPRALDLFAPGAPERLAQIAAELAAAGPDAVWFGGDLEFPPDEGYSAGAIAAAEQSSNRPIDAPKLLAALPFDSTGRARQGLADPAFAALCEARSGRLVAVLGQMIAAVKKVHPSCRLGAIVSAEAVADPMTALRDGGLDLDGLAGLPLDQLAADIDWRAWKLTRGLTAQKAYASMSDLSAQLARVVARPERGAAIFRGQSASAARPLPRWEIEGGIAAFMAGQTFGLVLAPPLAGPVAGLPTAPAEPGDEPRKTE